MSAYGYERKFRAILIDDCFWSLSRHGELGCQIGPAKPEVFQPKSPPRGAVAASAPVARLGRVRSKLARLELLHPRAEVGVEGPAAALLRV